MLKKIEDELSEHYKCLMQLDQQQHIVTSLMRIWWWILLLTVSKQRKTSHKNHGRE